MLTFRRSKALCGPIVMSSVCTAFALANSRKIGSTRNFLKQQLLPSTLPLCSSPYFSYFFLSFLIKLNESIGNFQWLRWTRL